MSALQLFESGMPSEGREGIVEISDPAVLAMFGVNLWTRALREDDTRDGRLCQGLFWATAVSPWKFCKNPDCRDDHGTGKRDWMLADHLQSTTGKDRLRRSYPG